MLVKPVAMLLENIPASPERGEPAHQHMDFLYIAKPLGKTDVITIAEAESREWKWFTRKEIEMLDEETEIFANVKRYAVRLSQAEEG